MPEGPDYEGGGDGDDYLPSNTCVTIQVHVA
jgi:hypothetical protein